MSCALQRACASRKIGRITNGVQTYKIRSRQLSRIHKPGFRAAAGAAGTVCGLENAVTCCMPGTKFSLNCGENQSHVRTFVLLACQDVALAKHGNCARHRLSKVGCEHEHEQETKHRDHAGRLRRDRAGDCRSRAEVWPSSEI